MTTRKKPITADDCLAAIKESKNDLQLAAAALGIKRSVLIRRLQTKKLKARYRAMIMLMAGGNVALAAKQIGISRQHLHKLISPDHEYYVEVISEAWAEGRETRIDMAESTLDANIAKGLEASTFFLLKTLAKDRGYVERQEFTGKDGAPIRHIVEIEFVKPGKQNGPTPRKKD